MSERPSPMYSFADLLKSSFCRCAALVLVLIVLLAATACGVTTTSQDAGGPTQLSSVIGTTAMKCVSPAHSSSLGGCIVQYPATGISLRVSDAYADVTSTVMRLETTNTDNYPLGIANTQLTLTSGTSLPVLGGYSGGPTILQVNAPLPVADFAPQVQLTATANFMVPITNGLYPPTLPPSPPWLKNLDTISISVPFMISPVRSGGYSYHQLSATKQGIKVQVQSLDFSPSRKTFYGMAGGARIELLFSGLPADMELLSFVRLQSRQTFGGATEGDNGPGLIELDIPGMTVSTPALTFMQNPVWPQNTNEPSVDPTIGSAGTEQMEVTYQGSGAPTGQPATLSISGIQLLTGGIDGNSGAPVLPTFQFTLPMR